MSCMLFVTPLRRVYVLEGQRLLMEIRRVAVPGELPGGSMAVARIIAPCLSLRGLVLFAEVAAAGFVAGERVEAHQLREFQEIGDAAGLFELLVEVFSAPEHVDVPPELFANRRDLPERVLETAGRPAHAAVVPHQLSKLAVY